MCRRQGGRTQLDAGLLRSARRSQKGGRKGGRGSGLGVSVKLCVLVVALCVAFAVCESKKKHLALLFASIYKGGFLGVTVSVNSVSEEATPGKF